MLSELIAGEDDDLKARGGEASQVVEKAIVRFSVTAVGCNVDDIHDLVLEAREVHEIAVNVPLLDVVEGSRQRVHISSFKSSGGLDGLARILAACEHIVGINLAFSTLGPELAVGVLIAVTGRGCGCVGKAQGVRKEGAKESRRKDSVRNHRSSQREHDNLWLLTTSVATRVNFVAINTALCVWSQQRVI